MVDIYLKQLNRLTTNNFSDRYMSQTNYLNSYKITFLTLTSKGQEMTYPLSLKYTYFVL